MDPIKPFSSAPTKLPQLLQSPKASTSKLIPLKRPSPVVTSIPISIPNNNSIPLNHNLSNDENSNPHQSTSTLIQDRSSKRIRPSTDSGYSEFILPDDKDDSMEVDVKPEIDIEIPDSEDEASNIANSSSRQVSETVKTNESVNRNSGHRMNFDSVEQEVSFFFFLFSHLSALLSLTSS